MKIIYSNHCLCCSVLFLSPEVMSKGFWCICGKSSMSHSIDSVFQLCKQAYIVLVTHFLFWMLSLFFWFNFQFLCSKSRLGKRYFLDKWRWVVGTYADWWSTSISAKLNSLQSEISDRPSAADQIRHRLGSVASSWRALLFF